MMARMTVLPSANRNTIGSIATRIKHSAIASMNILVPLYLNVPVWIHYYHLVHQAFVKESLPMGSAVLAVGLLTSKEYHDWSVLE